MLPIVSIFNLISVLFFGGIIFKLYLSFKKTQDSNIRNFFIAFLLWTIALLLLTSPGLILTDLKIIGLIFHLYPSLLLLSFIYLGLVPLNILSWERMRQLFLWGMVTATTLITVFSLVNWGPATVHYQDHFVYWEDTRGVLLNIIIGITVGLGLFLVMIFFLLHALKTSEEYVRTRAFLIVGGLLGFVLMAIINFIFGASAQKYLTSAIASFLGILSGLTILLGVFYKYKPSSQPIEKI